MEDNELPNWMIEYSIIVVILTIFITIIGRIYGRIPQEIARLTIGGGAALATIALALGTLKSVKQGNKNLKELRRERKEDEIKRLVALGLDPLIDSLKGHKHK